MTHSRSRGIAAALLMAGGLTLTGCVSSASGASPAAPAAEQPATLKEAPDGGPGVVRLSEAAQQRLDIKTTAVAASGSGLVIPYGAVVYQPDGTSWAYVEFAPRTYQRQAIGIQAVTGDQVQLTSGPAAGTPVVTQGAAELVGVESGIDGEE
jgi:hypothetical protein